ncbi:MAG: hypothetical protein C0504_13855 [Candidatus Solibacter sp.]|nr:hypothetical protein [Candidatus Solibacter sp.]
MACHEFLNCGDRKETYPARNTRAILCASALEPRSFVSGETLRAAIGHQWRGQSVREGTQPGLD